MKDLFVVDVGKFNNVHWIGLSMQCYEVDDALRASLHRKQCTFAIEFAFVAAAAAVRVE